MRLTCTKHTIARDKHSINNKTHNHRVYKCNIYTSYTWHSRILPSSFSRLFRSLSLFYPILFPLWLWYFVVMYMPMVCVHLMVVLFCSLILFLIFFSLLFISPCRLSIAIAVYRFEFSSFFYSKKKKKKSRDPGEKTKHHMSNAMLSATVFFSSFHSIECPSHFCFGCLRVETTGPIYTHIHTANICWLCSWKLALHLNGC